MDMKELLVEGTTKKVYATAQNDQVVVAYNDGGKKAGDRVEINNDLSAFLFEYLESYNVPTHFIRKLDAKSFAAKRIDMIPMIVSVHNIADAELTERFGLDEGKVLEYPVVEMYYKDKAGKRPMINEYHAYALGLCDRKEMTSINRIATKVNAVLKSFFDRRKLKLVSFHLEFGRQHSQILLADEMSLHTMTLYLVDENGEIKKVSMDDKDVPAEIKARVLGS